jgi:hypothetical protein
VTVPVRGAPLASVNTVLAGIVTVAAPTTPVVVVVVDVMAWVVVPVLLVVPVAEAAGATKELAVLVRLSLVATKPEPSIFTSLGLIVTNWDAGL